MTRSPVSPVLRRVGQSVGSLVVASVLIWALQLLAPGDPAMRILQGRGIEQPLPMQVQAERAALGLNRPALLRYLAWLGGLVRGDLGTSWSSGRPVSTELGDRLPATALLTGTALLIAVLAAVMLACLSATWVGRWPDGLVRIVCVVVAVIPGFLVATLLIDLVVLRWGHARVIADGTWHTVGLPAAALSLLLVDSWTRALRAGLLEALDAPYLLVAEARGASRTRMLLRHALPNALVPFLSILGVGTASLLAGAPIIETVFTWPGVGRYAVEAITARDVPVVQGFTLLAVTAYILTSLAVDLVALRLDPRIADTRQVRPHTSPRSDVPS